MWSVKYEVLKYKEKMSCQKLSLVVIDAEQEYHAPKTNAQTGNMKLLKIHDMFIIIHYIRSST